MAFIWNSLRLVFALAVIFFAHSYFRFRGDAQSRGKGTSWKKDWLKWGSAWALRILHVKVEFQGRIPDSGLLVSNHQGYLDILCLNILCPSVFVAKSEIRSWPLFGLFCQWSDTIFLDRRRKTALVEPLQKVVELLKNGERVVIFPEGTDSDGTTVLPFHSSFFEAAIEAQCPVIPLAIRYSAPGVGVGEEVIYWKDRRFIFHVIRLLGLRQIHAKVHFGNAIQPGENRKKLADTLHQQIADHLRNT